MLKVTGLAKWFGGLAAIQGLDFSVTKGELVGIIGPNGAGKTTLFNVISGFYKPTAGNVLFKGESLTGLKPHEIAARGAMRTFQSTTFLFRNLTVLDNVRVGSYLLGKTDLLRSLWGGRQSVERDENTLHQAMSILDFVELSDLKSHFAENLPHGYRRILGVAVALAGKPELLMMDEPTTGMNAQEVARMVEVIRKIQDRGVTILLVEHNMRVVMELCQRIIVLNFGKKLAEGTCEEIRSNPDVIQAYLGGKDAAHSTERDRSL